MKLYSFEQFYLTEYVPDKFIDVFLSVFAFPRKTGKELSPIGCHKTYPSQIKIAEISVTCFKGIKCGIIERFVYLQIYLAVLCKSLKHCNQIGIDV